MSGVLSIILAFTILALAPQYGLVLVGIIFGADLTVSGLAMLMISSMAFLGECVVPDFMVLYAPM